MRHRSVPARVAALLVVLPLAVASAVVYAADRDRAALPSAVTRLWQADLQLGSFMVCIQGVHDDVFAPGVTTPPSAAQRAAALPRLAGCGLDDLRAAARMTLPPTPSLQSPDLRRTRTSVEDAVELLRRIVLDAAATQRATEAYLRGGDAADVVAIGFHSLESESAQLDGLLRQAACAGAGTTKVRVAVGCPRADSTG